MTNTADFIYGNQYYLYMQNNNKCKVYAKALGSEKRLFRCKMKQTMTGGSMLGMIIDLKQYELTFLHDTTTIYSVAIDKSQVYHIFFGFTDSRMAWKVVEFDGNPVL